MASVLPRRYSYTPNVKVTMSPPQATQMTAKEGHKVWGVWMVVVLGSAVLVVSWVRSNVYVYSVQKNFCA